MLVLRSSAASPFVRKVRIAAALLGLADRITIEPADTGDVNDTLGQQNPLFKIPTLILEDGIALYDSRVIVEYLDHLAGGGIIIPRAKERFVILRQQALADGIMDAAILQVYEKRFRAPEHYDEGWIARQAYKVEQGLVFAENNLSSPEPVLHIGHIAQACALGFLDLRFAGSWRASCPKLVAWLNDFAARVPAYAETAATP